MISKVENALFKTKKLYTGKGAAQRDEKTIPMDFKQADFECLLRYLRICMNLSDFIKSDEQIELGSYAQEQVLACIPSFITSNSRGETLAALRMRVTSAGLTQSEIESVLTAISFENRVHVRRPGKKRLHCKAYLDRSPSEEEELAKPKSDSKIWSNKRREIAERQAILEESSQTRPE